MEEAFWLACARDCRNYMRSDEYCGDEYLPDPIRPEVIGGTRWLLVAVTMLLGATLFAAIFFISPAINRTEGVTRFQHAELRLPDAAGEFQPEGIVRLPDTWSAASHTLAGMREYSFAFPAPADPEEGMLLLIPRRSQSAKILLNGEPVYRDVSFGMGHALRWYRPLLVSLPPEDLQRSGNELVIRVSAAEGSRAGLSSIAVGDLQALQREYALRILVQNTFPVFANLTVLAMAIPLFLIWARARGEFSLYGIFALSVSIFAIRSMHTQVAELPFDSAWWRPLVIASLGWSLALVFTFLLRFAGIRRPGLEKAMAFYVLAGTAALFAWPAERVIADSTLFWYLPVLVTELLCVGAFLWQTWHEPSRNRIILSIALMCIAPAGIHDALWQASIIPFDSILWMPLVMPLMLVAISWVLADQFVRNHVALQSVNRELQRRVDEVTSELAISYEKRQAVERESIKSAERLHLIRDIHDGVGGRLALLLSNIERDALSRREIASFVREALADLRLILTARDVGSLEEALEEFCGRQRGLLGVAGQALDLRVTPDAGKLALRPRQVLNVLRIVQEAVSNAAMHGGGSEIAISCSCPDKQLLEVTIRDNGRGIRDRGEMEVNHGRGLRNMKTRAAMLEGEIDIRSVTTGTEVTLRVPLAERAALPAAE